MLLVALQLLPSNTVTEYVVDEDGEAVGLAMVTELSPVPGAHL